MSVAKARIERWPDELAEQHLPAPNGIAQEQQHGAAFHLPDDGVVRDQQGDQGQQEDGEAGQAHDDHIEGPDAHIACRRAAEEGEGEGEGREEERRGQDPPVPQALLDLLAGDDQDVSHRAASSERRKWA